MEKLQAYVKQYSRVAVAVSGDSNSALLLREAVAALGTTKVLAITAQTCCMPKRRLYTAKQIAKLAGTEHNIFSVETLDDSALINNSKNRCGYCHRQKMKYILDEAWVHGCECVLNGTCKEKDTAEIAEEIKSPFLDLKINDAQLIMLRRDVLEALPDDGCLYSRIAYGLSIIQEEVDRIDEAEEEIRKLGFPFVQLHITKQDLKLVASNSYLEKMSDKQENIEIILQNTGFVKMPAIISAEEFFA